jgi:hypothetical protein
LPKDESINAYVYAADVSCQDQALHLEPLGTLSGNANFDISFTDNAVSKVRVTGTITDCSGQPLSSGYVLVPPIENRYFSKVNAFGISNGIIDFTIDDCHLDNLNVQIYDFENSQDKTVFNVSLTGENTIDLGNLNICNNENSIFNGNVILRNQTEVNEFGMFNYKIIKGNLRIVDEANDITDLTPLSSLEEVRRRLAISGNQIQSLYGLHNLKKVNESIGVFQTGLTSLEGLEQITQTDELYIAGIKVKDNGVEKEVNKVKNTDKILVCYQTGENKVRDAGEVSMQLRLISPDNNEMYIESEGSGTFESKETGETVKYTKQATFSYENKNKKVCIYWSHNVDQSGEYTAEIYQDGYLLGSSFVELK